MPIRIYTPEQKIHIADVSVVGDTFCLSFKKTNQNVYETITLDQLAQIIVTAVLKKGDCAMQ